MNEYISSLRNRMPHFFNNVDVVEYVPHEKSKTIKHMFSNSRYYVFDPNSTDLSDVEDNAFNVAMSIDYLQYTPDYLDHLKKLHRVSSKFVLISCAAAGRHVSTPPPYYKNLVMSDFYNQIDLDSMFETYKFDVDYDRSDLYLWGVKKISGEV